MKGKSFLAYMLIFSALILLLILLMQPLTIQQYKDQIAVLFPKGMIGVEQRNLLLIIQAIMLLVILPVYFLTFLFSWRYRADGPKSRYDKDLIDNKFAEVLWWGIPTLLTLWIGVITWQKTYELDPFKPLVSDIKPLNIQVVALQWKWLFIYPEEKIATVNFLQFPQNTPLHFEITADAPMNSFWIPALGGQIYAMPTMKTELNLIANELGEFRGSSANISGEGFSGMHFIAKSSTDEEFKKWIDSAKESTQSLDWNEFNKLVVPTKDNPVATYTLNDIELFNQIIMKYMVPHE